MIDQTELMDKLLPLLLREGKLYKKWKPVKAVKVRNREKVVTITSSGIETINHAEKGDYIIQNMTKAGERYVVGPIKFKQLYTRSKIPGIGRNVYVPKGKVHALKVGKKLLKILDAKVPFEIVAPWGSAQIIRMGDFLVSPAGHYEFYGIAGKEFEETYKAETLQ